MLEAAKFPNTAIGSIHKKRMGSKDKKAAKKVGSA